MPGQSPPEVVQYVRATARFLGLPLDDAQVARVAVHLTRTKAMVELLATLPLRPDDDPAGIYEPAPFPAQDAP
jgi:1-carboxybiuret hydrolase subunit AtzG-like protein